MQQNRQKQLIQLIERQNKVFLFHLSHFQMLKKIQDRISQFDYKIKKVSESNNRNTDRLHRHRARLHQLQKCKDRPQHLLAYSGIMNEYVQAFMISHNVQMNVDVTSMNPDHMSYQVSRFIIYQQLLQLGQKIGKVSKGLSKQQIQTLQHIKIRNKQQQCPICCTQFQMNEIGIKLRCKHMYHQQCIIQWLKDQNRCPICKQYVLKQHQQ